jgi:glyoxylase-like metal-dependent hydrolase (beta-lactamase superfamily II)
MVLGTCLIWSIHAGTAAAQAPAAPVRSVTHVAGDVYRFQNNGHFGVFMVTPQGVVLVDPISLDASNWVKGEIATRFNNARVVTVLYSHHHWDHASGAAAFPGAKVISRIESVNALQGPPADAKLAGGNAAADTNKDGLLQIRETGGEQARNFAATDRDGNGGLSTREMFQAQFRDVMVPNETFNTAVKTVTLGGKMHHVSNRHAADLSYVYFPAEKVLFVVDVIAFKRLFYRNMPGFDEQDMIAALNKAGTFDTTAIVGGHGAIGTSQQLDDVRQYLADLKAGVQAGISKGRTLQQIQSELTLDKYASWENHAEGRPLNIEGMYTFLTRKQ